ncbi:MAG: hypothetical protein ACYSOD_04765, partial [Planctomycetota bacterium]
ALLTAAVVALTAMMVLAIPVRTSVTAPKIAAHRLQQKLSVTTASMTTATVTPTVTISIAMAIQHARAATVVTVHAIQVRTSATVQRIAERLRQLRRIVLTASMKTVTAIPTVTMATVTATRHAIACRTVVPAAVIVSVAPTNAVEENAGSRSM